MIKTLINTAQHPIATFVFAHGAGAGKNSAFMQLMADALAKQRINVIRFNFTYMQLAEELNKRRPPDSANKLLQHFNTVLNEIDGHLPIFIGGKSMGGRIASMLLENSSALGCICMGYPFHPLGKPEKLRIEHLLAINKPVLILQGERDTFGTQQEVATYNLAGHIQVRYLADGDHSFKPRKASGFTHQGNLDLAIQQTVAFIHSTV